MDGPGARFSSEQRATYKIYNILEQKTLQLVIAMSTQAEAAQCYPKFIRNIFPENLVSLSFDRKKHWIPGNFLIHYPNYTIILCICDRLMLSVILKSKDIGRLEVFVMSA